MVGIPCWVEAAFCAATTEAPHKRWSRRGGIPGRAFGAPAVGPVTLCSQKKSSSFRTIFPPARGQCRRMTADLGTISVWSVRGAGDCFSRTFDGGGEFFLHGLEQVAA